MLPRGVREFLVHGRLSKAFGLCKVTGRVAYLACSGNRSSLRRMPSSSRNGLSSSRYCSYWPLFSVLALMPSKTRTAVGKSLTLLAALIAASQTEGEGTRSYAKALFRLRYCCKSVSKSCLYIYRYTLMLRWGDARQQCKSPRMSENPRVPTKLSNACCA